MSGGLFANMLLRETGLELERASGSTACASATRKPIAGARPASGRCPARGSCSPT